MWQVEAWENELFDQYNGEGHRTQEEFEADAWDELTSGENEMLFTRYQ